MKRLHYKTLRMIIYRDCESALIMSTF